MDYVITAHAEYELICANCGHIHPHTIVIPATHTTPITCYQCATHLIHLIKDGGMQLTGSTIYSNTSKNGRI